MASAPPGFTVSKSLQIQPPQTENAILIPESQWNRLMDRIRSCGESLDWHWAIGWTAIGVAISSVVSAITLAASVEFSKTSVSPAHIITAGSTITTTPNMTAIVAVVACIVLALAAGIIAGCALLYSYKSAKHGETLRKVIVEDMEALASVQKASAAPVDTGHARRLTSREISRLLNPKTAPKPIDGSGHGPS